MRGVKELTLIRAPSEGSSQLTEPIFVSRHHGDQLHYEAVISGRGCPLGRQIPIAINITPLSKVRCHKIEVFVTENIQYFSNDKNRHKLEPPRKFKLFQSQAEGHSVSTYPGGSVRILTGGGVAWDQRDAAARGDEDVLRDQTNLLGDLEKEVSAGPTEMEFSIQLPSCDQMKTSPMSRRLHPATNYRKIKVNHWINVRALHPRIYVRDAKAVHGLMTSRS